MFKLNKEMSVNYEEIIYHFDEIQNRLGSLYALINEQIVTRTRNKTEPLIDLSAEFRVKDGLHHAVQELFQYRAGFKNIFGLDVEPIRTEIRK